MVQRPRPDLRGGCAAMRIPTVTGVRRRNRPPSESRTGVRGRRMDVRASMSATLTPRILILPCNGGAGSATPATAAACSTSPIVRAGAARRARRRLRPASRLLHRSRRWGRLRRLPHCALHLRPPVVRALAPAAACSGWSRREWSGTECECCAPCAGVTGEESGRERNSAARFFPMLWPSVEV